MLCSRKIGEFPYLTFHIHGEAEPRSASLFHNGEGFFFVYPSTLSVIWVECFIDMLTRYKEGKGVCFEGVATELSFRSRVLRAIRGIDFGKTATYQEMALAAGSPRAMRAVGTVCHTNPFPLLIPCHRVVAKNGLGGYAYGSAMKEHLLAFEATVR